MDTKKCIWMEAGAVEYQLCPLNQNCDLCDYHKEMTNGFRPRITHSDGAKINFWVPGSATTQFIPGLQYLSGHFWIKRVASGQIRLGIDAFLWRLFSSVYKVVTPKIRTDLADKQCFSWLFLNGGIIYLRTPVPGQIIETNPLFQEDVIQDSHLYPTSDLWLLGLEEHGKSQLEFLSKEKYLLQTGEDCMKLKSYFPVDQESDKISIIGNHQLDKSEFSSYLQAISFNHAFIC
ncbi:hypothetical protein HQ531_04075 [bacterium]|nr:hypothetical protein [bacterium]